MQKPFYLTLVFFWAILLATSSSVEAGGLSTGFGEVKIENLQAGQTYSTKEEAGIPLIVVNTSERTVNLTIKILQPKEHELIEGYEAIPDISWISLEKTDFTLEHKEAAVTDVTITIPDDEQYLGKKYQVYLWSYTTGRSIGLGLRSRLLFSIATEKKESE